MQDETDSIPTWGIFYDEAFDRVFNAIRPDAAELQAAIGQASAIDEESFDNMDEACARSEEVWRHWEEARLEVRKWFRDELATGALDIYRCNSAGDPRRLHSRVFVFEYACEENPPVFFKKADFEKWLRDIQGKKKKGSPSFDRAKIALDAVFGTKIPDPVDMGNNDLCTQIQNWIKKGRPQWRSISDATILRAAGRK